MIGTTLVVAYIFTSWYFRHRNAREEGEARNEGASCFSASELTEQLGEEKISREKRQIRLSESSPSEEEEEEENTEEREEEKEEEEGIAASAKLTEEENRPEKQSLLESGPSKDEEDGGDEEEEVEEEDDEEEEDEEDDEEEEGDEEEDIGASIASSSNGTLDPYFSTYPINSNEVTSSQSLPNLAPSVSEADLVENAVATSETIPGPSCQESPAFFQGSGSSEPRLPVKAKSLDFDSLSFALTKGFRFKGGGRLRRWYNVVYRLQFRRFKREERYDRQAVLRYTIKRHPSRENTSILRKIRDEVRRSRLQL